MIKLENIDLDAAIGCWVIVLLIWAAFLGGASQAGFYIVKNVIGWCIFGWVLVGLFAFLSIMLQVLINKGGE